MGQSPHFTSPDGKKHWTVAVQFNNHHKSVRLTIPEPIAQQYELRDGDTAIITQENDKVIITFRKGNHKPL